jgi:hypothetical protein
VIKAMFLGIFLMMATGCATYQSGVGHEVDMKKYALKGSKGFYGNLVYSERDDEKVYFFNNINRESHYSIENRVDLNNMNLISSRANQNFQCGMKFPRGNYGSCTRTKVPTSFHIISSGFHSAKYTFDFNEYQRAIIQASKSKVSSANLQRAVMKYNETLEKNRKRRHELKEISRIKSENILSASNKFLRLSRIKKRIGDSVCTINNKFGFVEVVSGEKIKILISGEVLDKKKLYFFGNPHRKINTLNDFEDENTKFNYDAIDRMIWSNHNEWAPCQFSS